VSKHHYALAFSILGYNVSFLNPPGRINQLSIEEGVSIIDYKQPFRGTNRLPKVLRDAINTYSAERINRIANIHEWDLIITFDAFRFQNPSLLHAKKTIFFPVDTHKSNIDLTLAENVDLVLTISENFIPKYRTHNKHPVLFNHGLADHFKDYGFRNWAPKEKIEVLYVGNLLKKEIDWIALNRILEENTSVKFVFVGPNKTSNLGTVDRSLDISKLESYDNVELVGEVQSSVIPDYIDKADLFLICYDANKYEHEVSNTHKVLEYLSSGKVVVANYTASYRDKPGLIEMADNQEELPRLFKQVVENLQKYNSPKLQTKRRQFALENTYRKHISKILNLIES
jgi:glycosyltransferase involved in cell wall biosynthesis